MQRPVVSREQLKCPLGSQGLETQVGRWLALVMRLEDAVALSVSLLELGLVLVGSSCFLPVGALVRTWVDLLSCLVAVV